LFNTLEFSERINKLTEVSKKIGRLCGKEAKGFLERQKRELDEWRSRLTGEYIPVPFTRLISWKEIGWDTEKLEFPDEQFVDWLGKGGELDKLEFFLVNIDEFRKSCENKKLDKILADEKLVTQLLLSWNFIDGAEEFNNKLSLKISIDNLLQGYEQGAADAIKNRKADLTPKIQELVKSVIDVKVYSELIADILIAHKNANILSQLLVDVGNLGKSSLKNT